MLLLTVAMSLCSCDNIGGSDQETKEELLSDMIIGEWQGQADVAQIVYKEINDELGIDLTPEPEYCDIKVTFYEDGTFAIEIDIDSFASAVGKCAEPYTSALFGFDTDYLVGIIMQYVANDMPVDSGREEGKYIVDNKEEIAILTNADGESEIMHLNEDNCLEYEDDEINQIIAFYKQQDGAI